jgi:hypothetical protein
MLAMEAWILHIRIETYSQDNSIFAHDKINAWMTEKQAYKAAAKYLEESTAESWKGPFVNHYALREAVKALIEADYVEQAINLVNEYSQATPYKSGQASSAKIHISINKSTFLGSPFE